MTAFATLRASFSGTVPHSFATLSPAITLAPPPPLPEATGRKVEGDEACQLVTDWSPERFPRCGHALVEQKHDGIRALWLPGRDGFNLWTRGEAIIGCASHVLPDLHRLAREFGEPMFFDAEYVEAGGFEATRQAFQTGGASRGDDPPGLLMIFDAMPLTAYERQTPSAPLERRKDSLRRALAAAPSPFLRYVAHVTAMSPRQAEAIAGQAFALGQEGVVVKDPTADYVRQRSATWQRIKRRLTVDCPIVEVEPVDHPAGTMAALIVQFGHRRVRVTVGLTPDQRRQLWREWPRLIGRVIEVEAMERTALGSLRQPRFSKWKD